MCIRDRDELAQVEKMVNEAIQAKVPVVCEEMTVPEAKEKGAIGLFESKYGEDVYKRQAYRLFTASTIA